MGTVGVGVVVGVGVGVGVVVVVVVAVVVVVGVGVVVGVVVVVAVVVAVAVGVVVAVGVGVGVAVAVGVVVGVAVGVAVVVGVVTIKTKRRNMNIEEMKLGDLLKLTSCLGAKPDDTAIQVGKAYLIRAVTLYYTGRVKKITASEIVLEDAAWIADTGRFNECLKEGKFNEVEPFEDDVIVPRGGIIDMTEWKHKLPRTVK